jgi:hypothetical protein
MFRAGDWGVAPSNMVKVVSACQEGPVAIDWIVPIRNSSSIFVSPPSLVLPEIDQTHAAPQSCFGWSTLSVSRALVLAFCWLLPIESARLRHPRSVLYGVKIRLTQNLIAYLRNEYPLTASAWNRGKEFSGALKPPMP